MKISTSRPLAAPALVAVLTLALSGFLGMAPASAHDSVLSTSPEEGETITTDPGVVSLTLTEEPLSSDSLETTIIKVTASDGHPSSSGEVTVDGPTISIGVTLEHGDEYTVDWRTVSGDGHPIEGSYTFTYAPESGTEDASSEDTSAEAEPSATESPSDSETRSGSAEDSEEETAAPGTVDTGTENPDTVDAAPTSRNDGGSTGLIIGIAAAAVILAAAAYFLGRRNRTGDHA